jgi:hypothetical protein
MTLPASASDFGRGLKIIPKAYGNDQRADKALVVGDRETFAL